MSLEPHPISIDTATYFCDERRYPLLAPLKEQWPVFRDEVLEFFDDPDMPKAAYAVPTSAKRAMRSRPSLWKTFAFVVHGRDPEEIIVEHGIKAYPSDERRRYIRERYFRRSRSILGDFAKRPENGVINVFFSYFEPGARLGLHINHDPYMHRAHLGLIVPDGDVAFRVRDETVRWEEGKILVFSPTNPHTAWNLTDRPRVVLIVDFYKPEEDREQMVAMEREQVARLMARNPASFGMSGGMFDLDEETKRRFGVPRIEATAG